MAKDTGSLIDIQGRFHDVSDLIRGTESYQFRDGYFFQYWFPILGAEQFMLIIHLREMVHERRVAARQGKIPSPLTMDEVLATCNVPRSTLFRWLAQAETAQKSGDGSSYLYLFVRRNEESRGKFRDASGQIYQKKLRFDVEMDTPLTPLHEQYFESLTSEERVAALNNTEVIDIDSLIAFFGERQLATPPHMGLMAVRSPASHNETPDRQNGRTPASHYGTLAPASHNETLGYPPDIHDLSTTYPQVQSHNETVIVSHYETQEDLLEEEDHYYGEDLPPQAIWQQCYDALWIVFDPHGLTGKPMQQHLKIRKPNSFCAIVTNIIREADVTPAECVGFVRQVYTNVFRRIRKTSLPPLGNPSSFYLISLRHELGLPDEPKNQAVPGILSYSHTTTNTQGHARNRREL